MKEINKDEVVDFISGLLLAVLISIFGSALATGLTIIFLWTTKLNSDVWQAIRGFGIAVFVACLISLLKLFYHERD